MRKSKVSKILKILDKFYGGESPFKEVEEVLREHGIDERRDFRDPFKNLVIGILSQNTNDRNSTRAYLSLKEKLGDITPRKVYGSSLKEIRDAIKVGGLYNIKAKRIKQLAKIVIEKFGGDLSKLLKLSEEEARRILRELPGIGEKTTDVFLAYCMNRPTFPIDTNVARVITRIGIVPGKMGYEKMREISLKLISPEFRVRAHELFLRLGRDYCRARKPLCPSCPIRKLCEFKSKRKSS